MDINVTGRVRKVRCIHSRLNSGAKQKWERRNPEKKRKEDE
jgi:hypothetical protein